MKKTIPILLILLSSNVNAQLKRDESKTNYPVIGFSSGYSINNKVMNAGLQFGYRVDKIYLSGDMIIPLSSNVFVPKIFTVSAGFNLSQFQPFISYSLVTIGKESEQYFKGTSDAFSNGFKLGYGLRYYFKSFPLALNVQKQGKELISSLTIYKAL